MAQKKLNIPPTIHAAVHRDRKPVIEIAFNQYGPRGRPIAEKIGWLQRIVGGISLISQFIGYGIHNCFIGRLAVRVPIGDGAIVVLVPCQLGR